MSSSSTRLYLGGLPEFAGVEEITKHLSGYGKLLEVKLHPTGYGFVQFDNEKDASDVLETFSHSFFMGKQITVEYARPLRKAKLENNIATRDEGGHIPVPTRIRYPLVITNMARDTCWQELKDFGRMAGGFVVFCDINKPRDGKGFIEYSSKSDANRAVKRLSGQMLCGNVVKLYHRDDYENRKRRAGHLPRSRSPARSCHTRKYHPSTSSPAFFAEAPHDMVASTRGWSLHKQRSRASTGTTNTEPSVDQIDPYAYVKSRRAARDALPHSSTTDEYDYYLHGRYEREWEQHQADVRAYNDPRWGYYM